MFGGEFRGKRVLILGHTGFKGTWLTRWLTRLGAEVTGFSLGLPTEPAHFDLLRLAADMTHLVGDIRNREALAAAFRQTKPDIVFHLAAQALVRTSYADPALTFETNVLGTMNVFECLRLFPSVQAAVIITSDKCYRNQEWVWGYRESDLLGGDDPYSASKGCAELVATSYFRSFFSGGRGPAVVTTRAGNVIGGGDWAPDRIVPDCVRAWSKKEPVTIRHPLATRPWQHVLEPLSGYLHLGAELLRGRTNLAGEAFNFGPDADVNQPVRALLEAMARFWPAAAVNVDPAGCGQQHESKLLKLSCDKALHHLNWRAVLRFPDTVEMTSLWYRDFYDGSADVPALTDGQISRYEVSAQKAGLAWSQGT